MDSKFYVSLEVARLLKEKGYDERCDYVYAPDGRIISLKMLSNWSDDYLSAPTKAEAIDWLDSKGIIVDVDYYPNRGKWSADICRESGQAYMNVGKYYLTRLEVEETAIIKALRLL
jgi:hypothetical protein